MSADPPESPEPEEPAAAEAPSAFDAQEMGARVQGFLLGIPLFFALLKLLSLADGGGLFRYQGF